MVTGLEIGGWFASAFLGNLADQIHSYIGDQYAYQTTSVKATLKSLEDNLNAIRAAIHIAERSEINNPGLKDWLYDLKDASYDAEDVLDKFEYRLLEDRVNRKNQVRSALASTSRKLSKHACGVVKRFLFLDGDLNELLEVVGRFDYLVAKMGSFIQLVSLDRLVSPNEGEIPGSRVTTSTLTESKVFGRESERMHLIELLLGSKGSEGESSSKSVHVLPIVGIGGVGKTTLAQSVYNDNGIKDHFDLRAWVCVSDRFEVKRLMKEISESASIEIPHNFHSLQNLDSIQDILKRGLAGKKFLIVLDDVWNVETRNWEILRSTLDLGIENSGIIVTTRDRSIADMMGTIKALELKGLAEKNYWKLFVQCAFGNENPQNYLNLESIAQQIAKRLGGLPLAAKTVGGVLKSNFKEEHWKGILESKLWNLSQHEDGIMPVLKLSYEHLPAHLRQCFIYCSVFPKDYTFSANELVQVWMAQGFIQANREKTLEDMGRVYLDELSSRCLFENTEDKKYVVHDLLHDLAQSLSHDETFRVEDKELVEIPERVRHLYIHADILDMVCNNKYAKKNLRSLVVTGPSSSGISLDNLKDLKGLRMLQLCFQVRYFPESVNKLIHLRYLEIKHLHGHEKLPKSLCKLYHLQVLNVPFQLTLPRKISNLINMRHLDANTEEIAGIGKLTCLQELDFIVNNQKSGYEMRLLSEMRQLRGLKISGLGNVRSKEEASEAKLDRKGLLKKLTLKWGTESYINFDEIQGLELQQSLELAQIKDYWVEYGNWRNIESPDTNPDEILEDIRPHQSLKSLEIIGYRGTKPPSWLEGKWLSNVSYISLEHCSRWKLLPPLGQLPFLKELLLSDMVAVEKIGRDFFGKDNTCVLFPSLEHLVFNRMFEWKEWSFEEDEEGWQLFPRLSYLRIRNCPMLRGPLFWPSPLKKLTVMNDLPLWSTGLPELVELFLSDQDISILAEWFPTPSQRLSSLETMEIIKVKAAFFTAGLEKWFQCLTSLQKLSMINCENLQSLPSSLKSLTSLDVLFIEGCSQIESLPEQGLPSSVRELEIAGCNRILAKRCRKDGLDWHKISHIPTIKINHEVVQRVVYR